MKYATHLLISLCFSFILVSCDSNSGGDDNNDNNGIPLPGLLGTMRADVDGQSWNAITATASRFLNLSIPTILLAGVDLTGSGISIGFADVDGVGTFQFSSSNVTTMMWTPGSTGGSYTATSGSVTITSYSEDNLQGTFAFEGRRFSDGATVSVTNGTFNAPNLTAGQ